MVVLVWVLPHKSVSSRDNGLPSVTTVRITGHNRASAAVLLAQGKQQEALVVDSALIKPSLQTNHTPLALNVNFCNPSDVFKLWMPLFLECMSYFAVLKCFECLFEIFMSLPLCLGSLLVWVQFRPGLDFLLTSFQPNAEPVF